MLTASLLLVLFLPQQPPACASVEVCRAEALIAHARQDYEAFHDLAWAAYRKGKPGDPELMLLVARAQSLSGRPGDALVMLERVSALGPVPEDVVTEADFARVRALPRWNEVHAKLTTRSAPTPLTAAAPKPPDKAPPSRSEAKSTPAKPELPKTEPPKTEPPSSDTAPEGKAASVKDPEGAPLRFTTLLSPTALAYDAVSKRFLIADRRARRIAAIDEHTGQVATLVGALGALGDIQGIGIDPQQGDLWVVSSASDGDTLHRTQLVSGRVLSTTRITGTTAPIVAATFVRTAGLVVADASGILWRVAASGRADRLLALEYVPRALASDASGRLYVSAGGPRLARFAVVPSVRRIDLIELNDDVSADGPFAVAEGRLLAVLAGADGYEIRSMPLKSAAR